MRTGAFHRHADHRAGTVRGFFASFPEFAGAKSPCRFASGSTARILIVGIVPRRPTGVLALMRHLARLAAAFAVLAFAAAPAAAHPGHGDGFAAGFAHPIGGVDHLLAMVAVGLWAVPAAFVAVMAIGGALGAAGVALPGVEGWVAVSVVALGLLVCFAVRAPAAAGAALVGLFALFHGHAHGGELPETASALGFGLGFVLATAALHGAGLAAGLYSRRAVGPWIARAGGAATAAAGLAMMVG